MISYETLCKIPDEELKDVYLNVNALQLKQTIMSLIETISDSYKERRRED